jgi:hypothetical protein
MKTDDLKKRLTDLIQARTHIVYFIAGLPPARQDPAYAQLAEIQAVIASGAEDPATC